jgi:hypothetical protein
MLNDIQLGYQHVSAIMNASSSLYYTPQKYREIIPGSARALLGLVSLETHKVSFFFFCLLNSIK